MTIPDISNIRKTIANVGEFLCKVGGKDDLEWDKVCMVYIKEMNQTFRDFNTIAEEQRKFLQQLLFETLKNAELLRPYDENGTYIYRVAPPQKPSILVDSFDYIVPYVFPPEDATAYNEYIPYTTKKTPENTVQEIVNKHIRILEQDRHEQAQLMKGEK